jgi:hypothetical protein
MKKLIFCLLCFVATHSFAQFQLGFQTGYNSSRFFEGSPSPSSDYGIATSAISSFNVGAIAEIRIADQLFLQPGLLYYGNGSNAIGSSFTADVTNYSNTTIRANYLRLPVNAVYKLVISDKVDALGGAGLYVAKGLGGTEKGYKYSNENLPPYTSDSTQVNNKVAFSSDASSSPNTTTLNSIDFGYDVLAGIQYKSFELTANYSRGLTKAYVNPDFDYNFKNNTFSVSVAYLFSVKK